jgi:hypothetical protein
MLIRSVIEFLLHKPFWTDFGWIQWDFLTMDYTWMHIYDGPPHPKKFKTQESSSKVLVSIFWDKDGILLADYLEKDAAIMAKYYVALLDKLKQQLISKR